MADKDVRGIDALVDIQVHAAFSMKHQYVHQLLFRTGEPLGRLDLVSDVKDSLHAKRIHKEPQAGIYIDDHDAHLKTPKVLPFSIFASS